MKLSLFIKQNTIHYFIIALIIVHFALSSDLKTARPLRDARNLSYRMNGLRLSVAVIFSIGFPLCEQVRPNACAAALSRVFTVVADIGKLKKHTPAAFALIASVVLLFTMNGSGLVVKSQK